MEVGQKIKLVRLHRGLTQTHLGDLLNLGAGGAHRIAQYEIGYRVCLLYTSTFVYGHYALLLPDDEEIYAYTRTLND